MKTTRLTKKREKHIRGYAQYDGPSEHIWMIQDLLAEIDALRDETDFLKDLAKGLQMGADSLRVSKELEKHDEREKEIRRKKPMKKPAAESFRDLLISHRKEKGLTLKDVGSKVGLHHSSISRLENGKKEPTLDEAIAISKVLGFSFTYTMDSS